MENRDVEKLKAAASQNLCEACQGCPESGCISKEMTEKRMVHGYQVIVRCSGFVSQNIKVAS